MGEAGRLLPERRQLRAAIQRQDVPAALRAANKLAELDALTFRDALWIADLLLRMEEDELASRWLARWLARIITGTPGIDLEGVDELRRLIDQLPEPAAMKTLRRHAENVDRATRRRRAA